MSRSLERSSWYQQATPAQIRHLQEATMQEDMLNIQTGVLKTPVLDHMLNNPQGHRIEDMINQITNSFAHAPLNQRVYEELIVLGPSGSGKTTLTKDLLLVFKDKFKSFAKNKKPQIIVHDYADSLEIARDKLKIVKNKVGFMEDMDYFKAERIDNEIGGLVQHYIDDDVLVIRECVGISSLYKFTRRGAYAGVAGIPRGSALELKNRVGNGTSVRLLALTMNERDRRELVAQRMGTTSVPHKDGNPQVSGQQVDDMLRALDELYRHNPERPEFVPKSLNALRKAIVREPDIVPKLIQECFLPNWAFGLFGQSEHVRAAWTENKRLPAEMVIESTDEELKKLHDNSRAVNVLVKLANPKDIRKTALNDSLKNLKLTA